jgi:hypothetical protein
MSTEQRDGIIDGIRLDVRRLHETWMELLFPRQRGAQHSVLGKWKPSTTGDTIKYRVWSAIGVPLVALLYPLMLFGVVVRFYSRRFDSLATRIGLGGTILLMTVVWGSLTAIVRFYGGFGQVGFVAVLVASVTAVVSSALAFVFWAKGGRATTVLLAYPFGVTAILLPPVVAAFYSDAVGIGGLIVAPIPMGTTTILMMVLPSTVVFGLICLVLGVKHGEFRATGGRGGGSQL